MFGVAGNVSRAKTSVSLCVAAAVALLSLMFVLSSDPDSFEKSASPGAREVVLRDTKIQGIGTRILIPSDDVVVRKGERVLLYYESSNYAPGDTGTDRRGSVEGVVSTVLPGFGFWVRFPQLDVVKGAYPPAPVPPSVAFLRVTVQF